MLNKGQSNLKKVFLKTNATQKSLSQSTGNNEASNFYNCIYKSSVSAKFEEKKSFLKKIEFTPTPTKSSPLTSLN